MSGKNRIKKGIESLGKQIGLHMSKLKKAREEKNTGLVKYYEKELSNLEMAKEHLEKKLLPKLKRKK